MPKICVALDVGPDLALRLAEELAAKPVVFKVGPSLLVRGGPTLVRRIKDLGREVFLDLKLHDIPNTVVEAVLAAEELGADYLTLHTLAGPEVLEKASRTASKVRLIGVTMLTSHGDDYLSLMRMGFGSVEEAVIYLSKIARDCGLFGVVCSAKEVRRVKASTDLFTVVPGVRIGGPSEDQRRVSSPEEAARLGADMIVMGREIYRSEDPLRVVEDVLERLRT